MDVREILKQHWRPLALAGSMFLLGLTTGYRVYGPKPITTGEKAAPAETLSNGSLLIRRDPDAKIPSLPKVLPEGAKVTRTVRLEFVPLPEIPGPRPPVEIDLNVLKMPDGTTRILAETTQGKIVGGVDIPREPARPTPKWAAGGMYSPGQKTWGAFLDRDLGPMRVGLEVTQTSLQGFRSVDAWVKVGVRF